MLGEEQDPLRCELVKSFETYTRKRLNSVTQVDAKKIPELLNLHQEVELVDWLMSPKETRAQFENLCAYLRTRQDHLKVIIFNILWALPESPLSRDLHALYSPNIRETFHYRIGRKLHYC